MYFLNISEYYGHTLAVQLDERNTRGNYQLATQTSKNRTAHFATHQEQNTTSASTVLFLVCFRGKSELWVVRRYLVHMIFQQLAYASSPDETTTPQSALSEDVTDREVRLGRPRVDILTISGAGEAGVYRVAGHHSGDGVQLLQSDLNSVQMLGAARHIDAPELRQRDGTLLSRTRRC